MKYTLTFIVMILILTACGRSDTKMRRQIVGTWSQGTNHTLAFSADGNFISIFGGFSDGHTDAFHGKWSIKRGCLVMKDVRSNSVAVSDLPSKIIGLDARSLDLEAGEQTISLTR